MAISINNIMILLMVMMTFLTMESNGLRILGLFPRNEKSHFAVCGELMKGLAERGHRVDVYSHFPLEEAVFNYTDMSLKGTLPEEETVVLPDDLYEHVYKDEQLERWLRTYGKSVCELMGSPLFQALFKNPPRDPQYDLIITEMSLTNCYLPWGRILQVPVVGVVTTPLLDWQFTPTGTPINLATTPSMLSFGTHPMNFWDRLYNVFNYIVSHRIFSAATFDQVESMKKYFRSLKDIKSATEPLKSDVSLVLVNHEPIISGLQTFGPNVVSVPGLHLNDCKDKLPELVQQWLEDSSEHGFVYVSLGSMRFEALPAPMLDRFYQVFETMAPVRFLIDVGNRQVLPPGLPSNALLHSSFQCQRVLKHKHARAFITNGEYHLVQTAIYNGVPMVIMPLTDDQGIMAYSLNKLGNSISVYLKNFSVLKLTYALYSVLKNQTYKHEAEKLEQKIKFKLVDPVNTANFWIEYIHKFGKDSLRSAEIDIAWWKSSLVDVIFLTGASLTFFVIFPSLAFVSWVIKKLICQPIIGSEKIDLNETLHNPNKQD